MPRNSFRGYGKRSLSQILLRGLGYQCVLRVLEGSARSKCAKTKNWQTPNQLHLLQCPRETLLLQGMVSQRHKNSGITVQRGYADMIVTAVGEIMLRRFSTGPPHFHSGCRNPSIEVSNLDYTPPKSLKLSLRSSFDFPL